ncbi:MAG: MarC family protein [Chitinophagaceae bacterium]|nr:MarC family protein [Chitinophagaceae bacterium]
MHFDGKEIGTISMILFAVIDIMGGLPVLVDLQQKTGRLKSEQITMVSGLIMILFLFLGESILNIIGIDIASFAIAGSFIIFFLALEMILGIKFFKGESPETVSIVPIAFPLIAGAGTLTTLLSLRSQYQHVENIIAAILINLVVVYFVLRNTHHIEKLLGIGGINLLRKIFGVILLALAVKLFKSNAF